MLCEIETNESDEITGVGPAQVPWPRCVNSCCRKTVKLQIRTRYKTGAALLCASIIDGADPDTYHTSVTTVTTYHRFASGSEIGTCTQTVTLSSGPNAIVSGSDSLPDCDSPPPNDTSSPDGCVDHLYDPPADSVTSDTPVISFGGDSATKDDVRSAAIAAMDWGDWSEWADIVEIDLSEGTAVAGYTSLFLAEAALGDNGAGGGSFVANASQYESELRVMGPGPVSIAVSEGTDLATATVNRYQLAPNEPQLFSVGAPENSEGWVSEKKVLRCACPVQFAAAAA